MVAENDLLPEKYQSDNENFLCLFSKSTKELNNNQNIIKTNEQENNNNLKQLFHRISLDSNSFNSKLPSPPHSPPPPTPTILTKCNTTTLTNEKNIDLNDVSFLKI